MAEQDAWVGLTDKQKEDTLSLMQIANIDDQSVAKHFMEMCNYDLNNAVTCYMETGQGSHQNNTNQQPQQQDQMEEEKQQYQPPQQNYIQETDNFQLQQMQQQEMFNQMQQAQNNNRQTNVNQEELAKYQRFLEIKKVKESEQGVVKKVVSGFGSITKNIWNNIMPVKIRGEVPGGEEFKQYLNNELKIKSGIDFQNGRFQEMMDRADVQKRPLMVFMYSQGSPTVELQKKLLLNQRISAYLNKSFYSMGVLSNSEESDKILKYVQSQHWPAFIFFRKNLYERNEVIETVTISQQNNPDQEYYLTKMKEIRSKFYMKYGEDNKIMQAEKEARRPNVNPFLMEEQMYYNLQQNQQQQVDPAEQEHQRLRLEEERRIKREQEEEYNNMIQESLKAEENRKQEELKQEEDEQQKLHQQLEHEDMLAAKLSNIPNEPAEGDEGTITIRFRTPEGQLIIRRFLLTDTAQLLYDYVQTNQEVEFETEEDHKVSFDLIQTMPPLNLSERLKENLNDIFDGSDFEQLIIREH